MPDHHVLPAQYRTYTPVTTIAASLLFILASCSTVEPEQGANNMDQASATASPTVKQQTILSTDRNTVSPAIDKTMDRWAKARAVYLRSLDYAKIDRQDNPRNQYIVKSNLIESRYHIKDSAEALYIEHDLRKAVQELRAAVQQYHQAISAAPADKADRLTPTETDLESLLKQEETLTHYCCEYPPREAYLSLETKIEKLLTKL